MLRVSHSSCMLVVSRMRVHEIERGPDVGRWAVQEFKYDKWMRKGKTQTYSNKCNASAAMNRLIANDCSYLFGMFKRHVMAKPWGEIEVPRLTDESV